MRRRGKIWDILSGDMTEEQVMTLFTSRQVANGVTKETAGLVWDKLMTRMSSYGMAIQVGQSLGKLSTSVLFNSSGMVENYYRLPAMEQFEDCMVTELRSSVIWDCWPVIKKGPGGAASPWCKTTWESWQPGPF